MALYNAPRRGPKTGETRLALGETLADTDVMGMMVVKASDGALYKGTDVAGVKVIGVNDGGERSHDSGDYIVVSRGTYLFQNSTTSAVPITQVGAVCYLEDFQTVRSVTLSHAVVAGRVVDVETAGVWVEIGDDSVVASGS